jgi:hypothetical protein
MELLNGYSSIFMKVFIEVDYFSVMELEKCRQANIRNEFETVSKRILVENFKVC